MEIETDNVDEELLESLCANKKKICGTLRKASLFHCLLRNVQIKLDEVFYRLLSRLSAQSKTIDFGPLLFIIGT